MIISRVRRTLLERRLVEPSTCVLAACSGGPDSAAMLAVLNRLAPELGFALQAVSIDHGLRADAARDLAIAREQAEQLGIPFHERKLELGVSGPAGGSIQAVARAARYDALGQLAHQLGAGRIAVGHTRDDQAETVIMRLLRGAGMDALAGIEPLRRDGVMRPLIDCDRAEVQAFARARFSRLAEDPSNRDARFERVRIRYRLLPALAEEDPGVIGHLAALADEARERAASVIDRASALLERARGPDRRLSPEVLAGSDPAARRAALRMWLRERAGVEAGRRHLDQIERALGGKGEIWLPGGWAVRADPGGVGCFRRF